MKKILLAAVCLISVGILAQQKTKQVSYLEIYDMETGKSTLVGEYDYNIQAPNWSPDGKWLVVNSRGKMYRIPVQGGEPILIPTGKCQNVNNDHVLTFDGKWLGISNRDKGVGSRVYIVPFPEGGEPRLVTSRGPSYLHGISPDNKWIAYTAPNDRNKIVQYENDIWVCPFEGGEERRLTTTLGLDDGSEYSKDGKTIWWSSLRDGTMQIYKMKADGGKQTQMTKDPSRVNRFPHISPDGKHVVYIAYKATDIASNTHPADCDVELMYLPAKGGEPKTLVEMFGGQGSFNVNSWSPDSKKFAYVRYSRNK